MKKIIILFLVCSLSTKMSFAQMTGGGGGYQGPTETVASTYDGPKTFWMPLGVGLNAPKSYLKSKFGTGVSLTDDLVLYFKGVSSDKVAFGMAINFFDISTLSGNTKSGGSSLFINGKIGFALGFKISDELTIDTKLLLGVGGFSPSSGLVTDLGFEYSYMGVGMRNQIGFDARYKLTDRISAIAGLNFNSGRQNFTMEYESNYYESVNFSDKINTKQLFIGFAITAK